MPLFAYGHNAGGDEVLIARSAAEAVYHMRILLEILCRCVFSICGNPLCERLECAAHGTQIPHRKALVGDMFGHCKIIHAECPCESLIVDGRYFFPVFRRGRDEGLRGKVRHCAGTETEHRLCGTYGIDIPFEEPGDRFFIHRNPPR